MSIQIGSNPWILILITFLELLFIVIPCFIASKIEKNTFRKQIAIIGISKPQSFDYYIILKIIIGITFGFLYYILGGYFIYFIEEFIIFVLGNDFFKAAQQGAISTLPIQPDIIQLIILVIQQFVVIALCEEAFFRGFLIKKLNKKFKNCISVIFSSLLFSLYHVPPFIVPIQTIFTFFWYYFALGLLLSLLFLIFKESLIPIIFAHGFFNSLILIF